jgi:glyoxylase I family protein
MKLNGIHHIAIICSDYEKSKAFYTGVLGMKVVAEHYREERSSYKTDLSVNGNYVIELFSFPDPPQRPTRPEAAGLRHLAFAVNDIGPALKELDDKGVAHEEVRVDEYTGRRFCFFADPDGLPIEFYEASGRPA